MKGYEVGDRVLIHPELKEGKYYIGMDLLLHVDHERAKMKGKICTIRGIHEEYTKKFKQPFFYLKEADGIWVKGLAIPFNSIKSLILRRTT